jgi:hypothetical protein
MKPNTIRGIHSILSGAFAAAKRWDWTDRNPAESARPPTAIRRTIPATSPEAVAKVIAEARRRNAALGLYLWLVVVTGVRRGELCGLQVLRTPARGTLTGQRTRSLTSLTPSESSWISRVVGITLPVSSSLEASTCETPPPASATAAAAPPHSGTTPTPSPRSTGELPPIWRD